MRIQVLKKRLHWYYRILGRNGKVLLTSETYATKGNAKRGAIDFRRWFLNIQPFVEVEDEKNI